MSRTDIHMGGCLCGSVRYSVTGDPLILTICHCRFCQRATGSTCLIEPIWRERDFSLTRGEPQSFRTVSTGSGKSLTLHFCGACGTKLHQRMERFPGMIGVYGGSLDQPEIALTARETWRIFLDDAAPGAVIPAGAPVWRQHRFDAAGQPLLPMVFEQVHVVGSVA